MNRSEIQAAARRIVDNAEHSKITSVRPTGTFLEWGVYIGGETSPSWACIGTPRKPDAGRLECEKMQAAIAKLL